MAKDLVIVTSYKRPEFLYLCLEHLYAARDSHSKHIRVYEDSKPEDRERFASEFADIQEVLSYWKRGLGSRLQMVLRHPNIYYGNSFSTLEAYKRAFHEDWDFVHLIEDDCLVTQDYFDFQDAVQNDGDYFCTIAGQCSRNPTYPPIVDGYFESDQYMSVGVCWKRENLQPVIQHACEQYYQNATLHILQNFKNSVNGLKMMEQDGLIQRVAEQQFQKFAFSCIPRALHCGVFGYHRGIGEDNMFQGTLAERIEKYREALEDPKWIEKVASFQTDIQPFPKQAIPEWNKVHQVLL